MLEKKPLKTTSPSFSKEEAVEYLANYFNTLFRNNESNLSLCSLGSKYSINILTYLVIDPKTNKTYLYFNKEDFKIIKESKSVNGKYFKYLKGLALFNVNDKNSVFYKIFPHTMVNPERDFLKCTLSNCLAFDSNGLYLNSLKLLDELNMYINTLKKTCDVVNLNNLILGQTMIKNRLFKSGELKNVKFKLSLNKKSKFFITPEKTASKEKSPTEKVIASSKEEINTLYDTISQLIPDHSLKYPLKFGPTGPSFPKSTSANKNFIKVNNISELQEILNDIIRVIIPYKGGYDLAFKLENISVRTLDITGFNFPKEKTNITIGNVCVIVKTNNKLSRAVKNDKVKVLNVLENLKTPQRTMCLVSNVKNENSSNSYLVFKNQLKKVC